MPIINMPVDLLLRLVNADRPAVDAARVSQTLEDMGVEVEEMTTTRAYRCGRCENALERTEAQGPPLNCGKCGADFRASPTLCKPLGEHPVARLNMLAVRPDIFDPGGMARYMRGFLGVRTGLVRYEVAPATLRVEVDPRLARDESYRPCIACAVLRNLSFDDERIRLLMNLQEDLHWALGRDRKLASIGAYDLGTICADGPLRYRATSPDELRFVPLGFSFADPKANLTPGEILKQHKTGVAYAHLLAGYAAYPLLCDAQGQVLSMPPIINSEATRVTMKTRACFIDVTGLAQRTVDRALNILVSGLKEVMPEMSIEAVEVAYADRKVLTPDFTPAEMKLDVRTASETIGAPLDGQALTKLLERMGHGVETIGGAAPTGGAGPASGAALRVRVPAWRNDVMHPVDLIEDAAIAFGFQNLTPRLAPTFTIGAPRAIEEHCAIVRRIFTGLGFHQVMTLPLNNATEVLHKWRLQPDEPSAQSWMAQAVRIENPISSEQTHGRASLLPGILETLSINKQYELPQHLFEVGDCCRVDALEETGAREQRYAAAVMIGPTVGYADVRSVLDACSHELGLALRAKPTEHASYIPGRVAAIHDAADRRIGTMGELHPEVLDRHGLKHAVAVMEFELKELGE